MKILRCLIPAKRIAAATAALALMFCLTACEEEKPSTEVTIGANRDANGDVNASADIGVSAGGASVRASTNSNGTESVKVTVPLGDRLTASGTLSNPNGSNNTTWSGELVYQVPNGPELKVGGGGNGQLSISATFKFP